MLRAALVGYGPRGREHARVLRQLAGASQNDVWRTDVSQAGVSLAGVCDADPAVLAPAIRALGVPGYATAAELLERTTPHLVVVATPPVNRLPLVQEIAAFPGVRAIVVEKPLALTLADARAMVDACTRRGVLCVVCHQLRHAPEFVALKRAIDAGEIGGLEFLRGVCYGNLLNQGVHLIDLMHWLTGGRVQWAASQHASDPETLARHNQGGQEVWRDRAHPAPMWMTHHLAFEGGIRASLETGLLYQRSRTFHDDWLQKRVTAVGSLGMAESQAASHCRILTAGQAWRRKTFSLDDYHGATRAFYEELLAALAGNGTHRNDAADSLPALEATLACLESAQRGDLCSLPIEPNEAFTVHRRVLRETPSAAPVFSIVIPLPDHRGLALDCVASWTQGQTYPRDRFELILLTNSREPDLDDRLRTILGPLDHLLVRDTDDETLLYDIGARQARGRWILFSEPHCIAEPQCLAELAEYLEAHAVDGACLRSTGITPNWAALLEERQYEQGFADFGRAGDWRKVILRGVAIARDAYLASGGFEYAFGRFAEWALAARLHAQGRRLGYAAGASVQHLYTTDFGQLMPHVVSFSAGEILYRDQQPAEYCDRYFGLPLEWLERNRGKRDAARALAGALGRRLWRWGEWGSKGRWLTRWLGQRLTAWTGWGLRRAAAQLAMRWAMLLCWLQRTDASYWHMYQTMMRVGRLQGLAQRPESTSPAIEAQGVFDITQLPEEALVGFHALETWNGQAFRWTGPVAALAVILPAGSYELVLETRGLATDWHWWSLEATLDGHALPCEADGGRERMRCRFQIDAAQAQRQAWLAFTCQPIRPWTQGQPDARELGMPLFAVRVEPQTPPVRVLATRVPAAVHTQKHHSAQVFTDG
ncbi:MAG: Gfo/Idh/MocA family oxidoreductase [Gemmataceae bacterium]|nr:Gfo/Idh/MocA family oxidoreductase [Gemmataceae bacterium]